MTPALASFWPRKMRPDPAREDCTTTMPCFTASSIAARSAAGGMPGAKPAETSPFAPAAMKARIVVPSEPA